MKGISEPISKTIARAWAPSTICLLSVLILDLLAFGTPAAAQTAPLSPDNPGGGSGSAAEIIPAMQPSVLPNLTPVTPSRIPTRSPSRTPTRTPGPVLVTPVTPTRTPGPVLVTPVTATRTRAPTPGRAVSTPATPTRTRPSPTRTPNIPSPTTKPPTATDTAAPPTSTLAPTLTPVPKSQTTPGQGLRCLPALAVVSLLSLGVAMRAPSRKRP